MGAKIKGDGTTQIEIEGVARLGGARHSVLPDRIETGTYAMAVAMTGGDILLSGARREPAVSRRFDTLRGAGAVVTETNDGVRVSRNGNGLAPVDITTAAVPGFPDRSAGAVHGADDDGQGHVAHHRDDLRESLHACAGTGAASARKSISKATRRSSKACDHLDGAPVMATDLRASVSLVIAALAARGETMVNRVYHLDRGFERLEHKLSIAARRSSGSQGRARRSSEREIETKKPRSFRSGAFYASLSGVQKARIMRIEPRYWLVVPW